MTGRRSIFLIGFMGSGKTAAARRLAELSGLPFRDTDDEVERTEGRTVEAIFRESGEAAFRAAERRALHALAGAPAAVVATGGGLFLTVENRTAVRRQGVSVWLDVSLSVARRRVGDGAGRPLWEPADRLGQRALYERRRAAYALADLRVDADGAAGEVAGRIHRRLGGCPPPTGRKPGRFDARTPVFR